MNFWWRIGSLFAVLSLYTLGVWNVHTWYDESKELKVAHVETLRAEKGQNDIIKFHQQIEKIYVKTKDNCLNVPVPNDVILLLK